MFTKEHDVFNILLGSVSEGVVVVDSLQIINETNASADRMFGYERHELIGQYLNILIPNTYHFAHAGHFNGFYEKA